MQIDKITLENSLVISTKTAYQFSSVQKLSRVQLFMTPWIAACQASLSITTSQSLLKLMSIKSVMSSSHLILCHPLLLLPLILPSIRVFSNESALHMKWPKYWSFSFSVSPSNEHSGLISFRMDWLDLLAVQGTLKSLLQHHSSKASILSGFSLRWFLLLRIQAIECTSCSSCVWMWELDYKESWAIKNWYFWTVVLRRLLRVPWTARRSNQSILKEISPEYSLEGLMLKLKLQYFGHLMWRADSLEKTLMLGKIEGRRRKGWQRMRWLHGITDSMDMSLGKLR